MKPRKLLRRNFTVEVLKNLIKAAKGELKSTLILKNANLVDVVLGDIREKVNIAVWDGYIVRVGYFDVDRYRGDNTLVIDVSDAEAVVPGFIDPHVHIESSMLKVSEFSKLALINGTTTVAADPHEIANVLGVEGVKAFIEESRYTPLRTFFYVPSCVPPTKFEFSRGAVLTIDDVRELMKYEEVIGLGEVMDFISVINADEELLEKISLTRTAGKVVDGHAPQLPEEMLIPYIVAGVEGDHESVYLEEALNKLRNGVRVLMREGSAWKDVEELSKILTYMRVNTRYLSFASDDLEVVDMVENGHMNRILRRAVSLGVDPITAVQMATLNAAEYLGLKELGAITPGRLADLVVLKSFRTFQVKDVVVNGELVVSNGTYIFKHEVNYEYPKKFYESLNVGKALSVNDFRIKAPIKEGYVNYLVIKAVPGKAVTKSEVVKLPVKDGYVALPTEGDYVYAAVVERHRGSGEVGVTVVKGLGFLKGALAQTIAHDVHNIVVVGKSPEEMLLAVNELIKVGGGMVAVLNGVSIASVELPIAGLISDEPYDRVYVKVKKFIESVKALGASFHSIFMTISLLSLPVIPELRITEKGVVDVLSGKIVNPILGFEGD